MSRSAVVYLGPGDTPDGALPDGLAAVGSFADSTSHERDGLHSALATIATGHADTLFVPRLVYAAGTLGELLRLVGWLENAGASLLAADVELDTAKRSGRRGIALLEEIDRWGREGDQRRRPRGRPGLRSGAPELVQRIAALRADGLSLQAIADRLNADGVPTPRGGASWRPSSVQSALGYRRPGPPGPGPPPPPHREGPPHRKGLPHRKGPPSRGPNPTPKRHPKP